MSIHISHIYQRFIFLSKKLFFLLSLLILAMGLIQLSSMLSSPPSPLPYAFQPHTTLLTEKQREASKQAIVVILGDRHGVHFNQYLPALREKLAPSLQEIKILNLSTNGHGIHRSIKKLQELPHSPPLIIFLGGYDEFYEKKFFIKQYQTIKKNLSLAKNSSAALSLTSLTQRPPLYPYEKEIVPTKLHHDPLSQQRNLELRLRIYEFEVQQLIDEALGRGSKLILTTAPVNLFTPPEQVCALASTPSIEQKLSFLKKVLEREQAKKIIQELAPLEKVIIGHARYHYLLGKSYWKESLFLKARKHLNRAKSFDCHPTQSSLLINNILRLKSQKNVIALVDFLKFLPPLKDRQSLFKKNSPFPKNSLYQPFVNSLAKTINQLYAIKEF